MDGQNYLVFHTAADDSYVNHTGNLRGIDVTSNTEITMYFASSSTANAHDSVVLNITAGTEIAVIEALAAASNGRKNPVMVIADDISSEYIHGSITSCGAISTARGIYKNVKNVVTNTTLVAADSGSLVVINPGATNLIQLPAAAGNAGWNVKIHWSEADGGTMDQIVNIGTLAGEFFNGLICAADGGGAAIANGTSNDFINVAAAATSGGSVEIVSDGTRMQVSGTVLDATDVAFADTAAS